MALCATFVLIDRGLHQTAASCYCLPKLAYLGLQFDPVKAYLALGLQL